MDKTETPNWLTVPEYVKKHDITKSAVYLQIRLNQLKSRKVPRMLQLEVLDEEIETTK